MKKINILISIIFALIFIIAGITIIITLNNIEEEERKYEINESETARLEEQMKAGLTSILGSGSIETLYIRENEDYHDEERIPEVIISMNFQLTREFYDYKEATNPKSQKNWESLIKKINDFTNNYPGYIFKLYTIEDELIYATQNKNQLFDYFGPGTIDEKKELLFLREDYGNNVNFIINNSNVELHATQEFSEEIQNSFDNFNSDKNIQNDDDSAFADLFYNLKYTSKETPTYTISFYLYEKEEPSLIFEKGENIKEN